MPETPQPQGYALFDLDQTLIPWDTQLLFCDFVLKRIPLRRLYLLGLLPLLPFYKLIGTDGMKRVFLNYLWGMGPEELGRLAEEFIDLHFPDTFYKEMLDVLDGQKRLGRMTVLSSASPEIWVRPIAQRLGVDHWFGTTVEMAPRIPLFPDLPGGNNKGTNKLRKMRHLLPCGFDLENGVLPNSCGFSDSHADLPMLRICESAVMVHPTGRLLHEGSQHGWALRTPDRPTRGRRQFAIACLRQALGIWK